MLSMSAMPELLFAENDHRQSSENCSQSGEKEMFKEHAAVKRK